jgi:hypothetical protein
MHRPGWVRTDVRGHDVFHRTLRTSNMTARRRGHASNVTRRGIRSRAGAALSRAGRTSLQSRDLRRCAPTPGVFLLGDSGASIQMSDGFNPSRRACRHWLVIPAKGRVERVDGQSIPWFAATRLLRFARNDCILGSRNHKSWQSLRGASPPKAGGVTKQSHLSRVPDSPAGVFQHARKRESRISVHGDESLFRRDATLHNSTLTWSTPDWIPAFGSVEKAGRRQGSPLRTPCRSSVGAIVVIAHGGLFNRPFSGNDIRVVVRDLRPAFVLLEALRGETVVTRGQEKGAA